jgi:riboflavin synthase alpha subunit
MLFIRRITNKFEEEFEQCTIQWFMVSIIQCTIEDFYLNEMRKHQTVNLANKLQRY